MPATLTSTLTISALTQLVEALDLSSRRNDQNYSKSWSLASGVGANQADKIFHDQRTIAASGTDSLDLAGVLTDVFGATITFARIKAVIVVAASGNINNVNVTRPASNGVPLFLAPGAGIPVRPGGAFMWVAPDATGVVVTGATGDLLDIVNSAGSTSVTFDIIVIGASA
ncbi:MAG TPA: hypothetical protein VJ735_20125 [Actinomycetes bacterium]|nr:hypothetical protein [Actinomycetes bacterium]